MRYPLNDLSITELSISCSSSSRPEILLFTDFSLLVRLTPEAYVLCPDILICSFIQVWVFLRYSISLLSYVFMPWIFYHFTYLFYSMSSFRHIIISTLKSLNIFRIIISKSLFVFLEAYYSVICIFWWGLFS